MQNKFNLPDEIRLAIEFGRQAYSGPKSEGKFISATGLLKSPRQFWLSRHHADEIAKNEDLSERLWALYGEGFHLLLERALATNTNYIRETRIAKEIGGWTVSGQFDWYEVDRCRITDLKTTSVFKIKRFMQSGEAELADWVAQLNIYAELCRMIGKPVKELRILCWLKDHRNKEALEHDYPDLPVVEIPITLWPQEKARAFILERLALLDASSEQADEQLPECSAEDRWASPEKWALMKKGNKRAVKLYDTQEEAESKLAAGHYVERRPGASTRCERYCGAAPFCSQFKKIKEQVND